MAQEYTCENTSLNQVPALFKSQHIARHKGQTLLDIGGGRYDKGIKYLWDHHRISAGVYDPFNRSEGHNDTVLRDLAFNADVVTCCNVLNVINCGIARRELIRRCLDWVKWDGTVYFQVYEGDRTGNSRPTTKGYQMNQKAAFYQRELLDIIEERPGDNIVIEKQGNVFKIEINTIKIEGRV